MLHTVSKERLSMVVRTIDIAHPPLKSVDAEQALENELQSARLIKERFVLKVIHGYGSQERPGVLKEVVRNWTYRNCLKLLAVIPGEEYNIFDANTIKMRKACGQMFDSDLGTSNPGITLIWIK
jgi:hypothetical protein